MKRIGIAASRIAKDDLVLYNLFVVILAFLLSQATRELKVTRGFKVTREFVETQA